MSLWHEDKDDNIMPTDLILGIAAIVISLVGAIGGAIAWLFSRRMFAARLAAEEVDTADKLSKRITHLEEERARDYGELVDLRHKLWQAQARIHKLEREYTALQAEHVEYKRGVDILVAQLSRLGHEPEWRPE